MKFTTSFIMTPSAYLSFLLIILEFIFASSLIAGDISRDVRLGNGEQSRAAENYLELGAGFIAYKTPTTLGEDEQDTQVKVFINGRYQWRGLFVEAFAESYQGVVLGYNAFNTEHWSIDVIGHDQFEEISQEEYEQLQGIETRRGDFAVGVRATAYYHNFIMQFQVLHDITGNHGGVGGSTMIGRNWQWRNWNFHSLLGLHYQSADTLDYYFGVSSQEASAQFPEYDLESETMFTAEVGVTYPLSEKWIWRSTLIFADVPEGISNSPIMSNEKTDDAILLISGLSYVF